MENNLDKVSLLIQLEENQMILQDQISQDLALTMQILTQLNLLLLNINKEEVEEISSMLNQIMEVHHSMMWNLILELLTLYKKRETKALTMECQDLVIMTLMRA